MSAVDIFDPPADTPLDQTGESSLTQQQFKEDSDINTILARYETTGVIEPGSMNWRNVAFGNFTAFDSFETMVESVMAAQSAFMTLPAAERALFNNDLSQFSVWLDNPANFDTAIAKGYIDGPLGSGPVTPEPGLANPKGELREPEDPAFGKAYKEQVAP